MAATRKKAVAKPKPRPAAKKAPVKKAAAKQSPAAARPAPASPARPAPPPPPPAAPAVDHAARIGDAWRRLTAYAASIDAPPLALRPGASEKAIAAAEKTIKLAFPPDFRASLKLHDGQGEERSFPWMPGCPPLWPVETIVERWHELQKLAAKLAPKKETVDAHGRLKGGVYRTGRIPIADKTFLDLDPGPAGVAGQLVTMVGKTDLVVIDTSFGAALERWAGALERGVWVYDRDKHTTYPRAVPLFVGHPAGLFSRR